MAAKKNNAATAATPAGVANRLMLCEALLRVRGRVTSQDDPFKNIQMRALVDRRVQGIRVQLLPGLGGDSGSAVMAPLQVQKMLVEQLSDLAQQGTPALQLEAALRAESVLHMAKLIEAQEADLGIAGEPVESAELTGFLEKFKSHESTASEPDYMHGHAYAIKSVERAIEQGAHSPELLDAAKKCAERPKWLNYSHIDGALYQELQDNQERYQEATKRFYALVEQDDPVGEAHKLERAKLIAELQQLREQGQRKHGELVGKLDQMRNADWAAKEAMQSQGRERMRAHIEEMQSKGGVDAKQAAAWASSIEITPEAEAALRKGSYPPSKVRKDAAEFFRLVRGRLEKVRILTHGKARAAANSPHGKPGQIFIPIDGKDFNKRVLWHELGHHIEADPSAAAAARAFIRMRSEGGKSEKLSVLTKWDGYEHDEIAFVDHFFEPYMGKIYSFGMTEVFSMVLESYSDPDLLAGRITRDPQSFAFVNGFIGRQRDALEQLHLQMRQQSRHTIEQVENAKKKAVEAFQAKAVAAAALTLDQKAYVVNPVYLAHLEKLKAVPVGTMPGSAPNERLCLYTARVTKETEIPSWSAKGKKKTRTVRTKVDGYVVVLTDAARQYTPIRLMSFTTDNKNWVLAFIIKWRDAGFATLPNPAQVSKDLEGMIFE